MKKILWLVLLISLACLANASDKDPRSSNGIHYPHGWRTWSVIAVSHRRDNKTLRVILGNKVAIKAARSGKTHPWPNGTMLAKVVWKDTQMKEWKSATVPGQFVHVEFMLKDSRKYSKTYGWGWARWIGREQRPFNKGPEICISCHSPVKKRDWVYTKPAVFPKFR